MTLITFIVLASASDGWKSVALLEGIIPFQAEVLAPRVLYAGNVVVTSNAGIINIAVDTASNAIFITQVKDGHLKVAGAPGTTVNGQIAITTDPVTQYVTIAMGAGDDLEPLSPDTAVFGQSRWRRGARTIADMEKAATMEEHPIAEAVQYRLLDRKF